MADGLEPDGRSQRRLDNRARIYDAALRLLRRRAYHDLTVDEICDAAGVGRATFFRIFESKAGLLREFNRRLTARIVERLDAETPADTAEALGIVVDEIAETWTRAGPGAAEMALEFIRFSELGDAHAAHPELFDVVVEIVERGVKRRELRRAHPPRLAAALVLLQITAPVGYWFEHPEASLRKLVDEALATWLHGALRSGIRADAPRRMR